MIRARAVIGDHYHCSDLLKICFDAAAAQSDTTIEWSRYPDPPDASPRDVELLILASMGVLDPVGGGPAWMDESIQTGISDAVRRGMGLLAFHAGTASHPTDGAFRELVGGHFVSHPPEHDPVTVRPLVEHPVCAGVQPFTRPDEHYVLEHDGSVRLLFETKSVHGTQVGGWVREVDGGRVCVLAPGHTREMLLDPNMIRLTANAFRWCARK